MEDNDERGGRRGGERRGLQQQQNKTHTQNSTYYELVFRLDKHCNKGGQATARVGEALEGTEGEFAGQGRRLAAQGKASAEGGPSHPGRRWSSSRAERTILKWVEHSSGRAGH